MKNLARFLAALALAATALGAAAQEYPSKSVTIIVPFTAGGATDISARAIAALLTKQLGQTFVVDNKVGAAGMIGMAAVARAAPDGYTLGWGGNSPLTVAPFLSKNPPYNARTAFAPISTGVISSWILTTQTGLPVNSVAELVARAKANPGKLTIASSGIGSAPHLMGELFKATAGIDLLHVPFKGEIDGVNALLGGTVDMMFTSTPTAAPQVKAGKLKGLAVTTARRDPAVPNLPSVVEAGQPELTTELFFGMLAPAGTPAPIIAKLAAALKIAVADPGYAQTMEKVGVSAVSNTPEEFTALLKRHNDRWTEIIKRNNLSTD
jgi:tripartite-type tricarboxylate transporter receptor subunit TctC